MGATSPAEGSNERPGNRGLGRLSVPQGGAEGERRGEVVIVATTEGCPPEPSCDLRRRGGGGAKKKERNETLERRPRPLQDSSVLVP